VSHPDAASIRALRRDPFTWMTLIMFVMITSVVTLELIAATAANNEAEAHKLILTQHRARLARVMNDEEEDDEDDDGGGGGGGGADKGKGGGGGDLRDGCHPEDNQILDVTLALGIERVEVLGNAQPITICGLTATSDNIFQLLSASGTLLAYILSKLCAGIVTSD
jgi:hypothetical protein